VIDASAFQLLLMVVTGWLARREREVILYLIEENRCLRRQLGTRRVRLTHDGRRALTRPDSDWWLGLRELRASPGLRRVQTIFDLLRGTNAVRVRAIAGGRTHVYECC
jgi:hypothetical protein